MQGQDYKLIGERRFGNAWQLHEAIEALLATGDITDISYVRVHDPEDGGYASVVRLWKERLTDGSYVTELHIL